MLLVENMRSLSNWLDMSTSLKSAILILKVFGSMKLLDGYHEKKENSISIGSDDMKDKNFQQKMIPLSTSQIQLDTFVDQNAKLIPMQESIYPNTRKFLNH